MPLPIRMAAEFPPELVATPLEDIDPYYADKKVGRWAVLRSLYYEAAPSSLSLNSYDG